MQSVGLVSVKSVESFNELTPSDNSVFTDSGEECNPVQTTYRAKKQTTESRDIGINFGSSHRNQLNSSLTSSSLHCNTCDSPTSQPRSGQGPGRLPYSQKKHSSKDSGYSSRLGTDETSSSPDKSSPRMFAPVSLDEEDKGRKRHEQRPVQILTLACSPVLINGSYPQFYYVGDPPSYWSVLSFDQKLKIHQAIVASEANRKHPHKPLLQKMLSPTKSASCSSLDRLSLTASLEDYAINLGAMNGSTKQDSEASGTRKERLLSVTRFETFTTDLESPKCAMVVRIFDTAPSTEASIPLQKKLEHNLSPHNVSGDTSMPSEEMFPASQNTMDVILTAAGQAKLRRGKKGKNGRQRAVLSDDLMLKVSSSHNMECSDQVKEGPTSKSRTVKNEMAQPSEQNSQKTGNVSRLDSNFSAIQDSMKREDECGPNMKSISKSTDTLSDMDRWSSQLRRLAQSAQSTTNLDLSQRASETASILSIRPSQSLDDLTLPMTACVGPDPMLGSDYPREGFL